MSRWWHEREWINALRLASMGDGVGGRSAETRITAAADAQIYDPPAMDLRVIADGFHRAKSHSRYITGVGRNRS
jgi:hypothetical protein